MPTTPERLAYLEALAREHERRISELSDEIDGGPTVAYPISVRGKLHAMQSAMASAEKLREAAVAAAQAQRAAEHTLASARGRRLSALTQTLLVVCGIVTAAAPYVLHFAG